ncbi:hypothetical protein G5I_13458 [Acromyrmex echinatior]|uniref:Uncharacterized protein n=1 Tax=Acromyrmex echinatior TaxID=103372 RepID=F4X547_ACREC|nr:hypothetical protein G5I_13458 [Acromyrmex echinatior]
MVRREVVISTFCSTLAFVPAENRTMIQNVGGVGRKGRLSVYRARMAVLTQRYRAYHFALYAKRRSVGRGNPTLLRRTKRRECVESICHGAGHVDTNRQEGSGKKYSHFPRSGERRQGLAMGSGREMEIGAHREGNGRGARTKGSKILIEKEGGTQLRQQMFNHRLTTRSATTDYITTNDNQFSNATPNTRLRYTSLKKKRQASDKAGDNNRSGGESRLPEVYAKRKLVEHTIRDITSDLDR